MSLVRIQSVYRYGIDFIIGGSMLGGGMGNNMEEVEICIGVCIILAL
jgi:hypothetical protein